MSTVQIGRKQVGDGQPCYVIAEVGINHNGDIDHVRFHPNHHYYIRNFYCDRNH